MSTPTPDDYRAASVAVAAGGPLTVAQRRALLALHLCTIGEPYNRWTSRESLAYVPPNTVTWSPPPETRVLRALVAKGLAECLPGDGYWPSWRMTDAGRERANAIIDAEYASVPA